MFNLFSEIDQSELLGMMSRLGVEVSKKDLEDRMLEFDHDKDGTIDFPEVFYMGFHFYLLYHYIFFISVSLFDEGSSF